MTKRKKYLTPLFLVISLSAFFHTMAQRSVKPRTIADKTADSIFERSKGHWRLPLTAYKKIWTYEQRTRFAGGEPGNPSIVFYTDSSCDVKAVFDGKVLAVFEVGETHALMTQFGDYFITYSDLCEPYVKKGDSVKAGQVISRLFSCDFDMTERELEIMVSDRNDKTFDPYRWFDWGTAKPPALSK